MSYDDIINEHRPPSLKKRMPRSERAKIFMPFAALKGYEEATAAQEDVLSERIVLSEERQAYLNEQLQHLQKGDKVKVTYFVSQNYTHGHYVTYKGCIKRCDGYLKMLVVDEKKIPFEDLYALIRMS